MPLYRCDACGSPNVVREKQTGGIKYDYAKGALGSAILGPGGAAAGITNSTEIVYKCPDCGLTLASPMPESIKTLIDLGVSSLEARGNLKLDGTTIPWEVLTRRFKNIEKGNADRELEEMEQQDSKPKKAGSIEWELALDFTSPEGKAYLNENYAKVVSKLDSCSDKLKSKEAELYSKYMEALSLHQEIRSLYNTICKKRKIIEQFNTLQSFFRRKEKAALQQELINADNDHKKAKEVLKAKFKEWGVMDICWTDFNPPSINSATNHFIRFLHKAYSGTEAERLADSLGALDDIAIAVLAYSIFDGLGREYMTGKQLYDALMFYSHRLIDESNPFFKPQLEMINKHSSARFSGDSTVSHLLRRVKTSIGGTVSELLVLRHSLICGNFALLIAKDPPNFFNVYKDITGNICTYKHRSDYGYEYVRLNDAILSLNKIWL